MPSSTLSIQGATLGLLVLLFFFPPPPAPGQEKPAAISVRDAVAATDATTGVHVLKGTVEVPLNHGNHPQAWLIENAFTAKDGLVEMFFAPDDLDRDHFEGERMARFKERRAIRERKYQLNNIFWQARRFAEDHGGTAPRSLEQLKNVRDFKPAPGIFMVPEFRLGHVHKAPKDSDKPEDDIWRRAERAGPFLIDLNPVVDDGKHWTLDNWGFTERKEIDPALLKKYNIEVIPKPVIVKQASQQKSIEKTIYARVLPSTDSAGADKRPSPVRLVASNLRGGDSVEITWNTVGTAAAATEKEQQDIVREWAKLRAMRLHGLQLLGNGQEPMATHWLRQTVESYQLNPKKFGLNQNRNRRRGRTTDAMSILGGRAAIRETLQLRNLVLADNGSKLEASIPLDTIKGVEVKAHPFKEMLESHLAEHGSKQAPTLALANYVPPDRFFAYFRDPSSVFSMLEGGSEFVFSTGTAITGNSAAHGIKQRYLEQMGVSEALLRRFLATGAVREMAVCLPDLHLIDGTETSAVLKLGKPFLATAALGIIGVPPGNGTTQKTNAAGRPVHFHRDGDVLLVSSSKTELEAMLAAKAGGRNLGASDEFRYMLTQVPMTADTATYLYFSDPFIRHLTGPEAKIGQLRRLAERAELEEVSAGALLASFDGHRADQVRDLGFLEERGYIRERHATKEISLDEHFVSLAPSSGRANRMRTLSERPLVQVSPREKEAYDAYREAYERFWRRFFDPIAIRYEKLPDGSHSLETFILPLIDNSLYNGLRQIAPPQDSPLPLRVPVIEPAPVGMMSFNLNEKAMLDMMEEGEDMILGLLGLDGSLLDLLGPDVHLALQDADPIIGIGSGELAGMFGEFGGRLDDEMVVIPAIVSMLTRPCNICIGVQNPAEMRKKLDELAWPAGRLETDGWGEGSLSRVTGQQKWIYRYSLEDVITLRFGIEVQDRYLVINNLPFSNRAKVTGSKLAPNSVGYLELSPAACSKQLPALFASMVESGAKSTRSGAASLAPLMMAGADSIEAAAQRHADLFGFKPLHPAGGSWTWDARVGAMESSLFGSPWEEQQPPFDPDNDAVGLMKNVHTMELGMQFEDDGLRSRVRWRVK